MRLVTTTATLTSRRPVIRKAVRVASSYQTSRTVAEGRLLRKDSLILGKTPLLRFDRVYHLQLCLNYYNFIISYTF